MFYVKVKGERKKLQVVSIEDAQSAVRNWIDSNGFGASDVGGTPATVYDHTGRKIVGHISYNGRFWPKA